MTYQEFINGIISERGRNKIDGIYMEQHHIIPRCMNGTNDKDNLVYLTLVEHLRAHILLFRENSNNPKLARAAFMMSNIGDNILNELMLLVDDEEEFAQCSWDIIKAREKFIEDKIGSHLSEEAKQKISASRMGKYCGKNNPIAKQAVCLETGKVFDCLTDIEREMNINHHGVSACCKNKRLSAGGYHWMYYEDWVKASEEEIQAKINAKKSSQNGKNNPTARQVICLETNQIYDCIMDIERSLGIDHSFVSKCCKDKKLTAKGYHWMYYEEYLTLNNR